MSPRAAARLKSLPTPDRPTAATPAAPPAAGGDRQGAARQGVRSDPGPRRGDGRRIVAWLHLTAPGRGAVPTAHSWCACGHDRSAVGHRQVLALIDAHTAHRENCPLRTTTEGRNAA
ncbi:hypothetical protein [Streptomyces verrucosisporus]|uniref:hypothetical protein n=1 Tax=Streptomyces verrucosisporus TaxID=1695161 RepID=UPI001F124402|nr:hypothetical protein [Streptomyces verrucosisporus]